MQSDQYSKMLVAMMPMGTRSEPLNLLHGSVLRHRSWRARARCQALALLQRLRAPRWTTVEIDAQNLSCMESPSKRSGLWPSCRKR